MVLTHYVVVRRDLPAGAIFAALVHAAGESFYRLCPGSSDAEHQLDKLEVEGSNPSPGATFVTSETMAVVLGARNEGRLRRLADRLLKAGIPHVAVEEEGGALHAIGLVPGDKAVLSPHVNEFNMFRELERLGC